MFTDRGIGSESWVYIDSDCPLTAEVESTQVLFELGHKAVSLNLAVSAEMMPKFAKVVAEALIEMAGRRQAPAERAEHINGAQ